MIVFRDVGTSSSKRRGAEGSGGEGNSASKTPTALKSTLGIRKKKRYKIYRSVHA